MDSGIRTLHPPTDVTRPPPPTGLAEPIGTAGAGVSFPAAIVVEHDGGAGEDVTAVCCWELSAAAGVDGTGEGPPSESLPTFQVPLGREG